MGILGLLSWEFDPWYYSDNTKEMYNGIKNTIIGGDSVKLLSIDEIFSENYINKTNKIFNVGLSKIFKFLGFTLFPFALNTYSIIKKWIERPERDPNEFHNWSLLSVIHIEFAGLVFMLSNLSTNLFMLLFSYYLRIEDDLDSYYSYYLNLKILSLVALFYFFAKILIIFKEEFTTFYNGVNNKNYTGNYTYNYTYDYNLTYSNYSLNSTETFEGKSHFDNIDIKLFYPIPIICFTYHFSTGLVRLSVHNNNNGDKYKFDPGVVNMITYSIKNIGQFSLLRIISWTRHRLLLQIKNTVSIIKKHTIGDKDCDLETMETSCFGCIEIICGIMIFISQYLAMMWCCCEKYFWGALKIFPIIFESLIVLLVPIFVSLLGFIIKVEQISFVNTTEIYNWEYSQWLILASFMNNILALDTGKELSLKQVISFMFSGEDAEEDLKELQTQKIFINMIISRSLEYQGLLKTIIMLTNFSPEDLQKLILKEGKYEKIPDKEEDEKNKILENCEDSVEIMES